MSPALISNIIDMFKHRIQPAEVLKRLQAENESKGQLAMADR